ncbi:MAG TPA: nitrilase family protein [Chitinophagaceae bacterium]|nr:nitrilase family protein [Chitinophagaceae bacterium]
MSHLTFTLVQSNLHWEDKKANLQMWEEKIFSIKNKAEIVVLPEMFTTGFSMKPELFAEKMDGPTIEWMKKIAQQKKIILTGSVIIEEPIQNVQVAGDAPAAELKNYYNRLIWMLPNGEYGYYDKRHLFAYAEEDRHYRPGNKRLIASVKGWKINLQVCYDLRFPVWARQVSTEKRDNPEYDVLIYVANWPQRRNHAWKTLLQARAIENQCYVIGVNRVGNDGNNIFHSGDSMVIDPLGEILYQKTNEEDIYTITLSKEKLEEARTKFPFWKDGDNFQLLL